MNTAFSSRAALRISAALLAIAFVSACARNAEDHRSFDSAQAAVDAFVAALEADDVPALRLLLGPGSEDLLSSGDAVADKKTRQDFLAMYRAKHELVNESDGRTVLQVGENDWPLPIPAVQREGRWVLDGAESADELVFRRVGRNELGAIAVCRGFVEAQEEYAAEGRDDNEAGTYAAKLVSDLGQHNGLYWRTADDEPVSPAGPFIAGAAAEGYRGAASGERKPYHGYYYRMLYAQGPNADGGAREYFVNGLLTAGFAAIAWPADYGTSGVKTFIVNQDGIVFEKDLGAETDAIVETIDVFDPESSWMKIEGDGGAGT